jgi:hypothetical protein
MGQPANALSSITTTWKATGQHGTISAIRNVENGTGGTRDVVETLSMLKRLGVEQFAITVISLYFHADLRDIEEQRSIEQRVLYYGSYLSNHIRQMDFVLLYQQETQHETAISPAALVYRLYFLLAGVSNKGAAIIKDQLWETLLRQIRDQESDEKIQRPAGVAAGYSAYPHPCETIQQSLEEAHIELVKVQLVSAEQEQAESRTYQKQIALAQMAQSLGIPYISIFPHHISTRLKRLITPALAQELQCYPLGRERNVLTVAMVDPCDQRAVTRLQHVTGLRIFPVLADANEMRVALKHIV